MYSNIRIFKYILFATNIFLFLNCSNDAPLAESEVNFQNRQWYRKDPIVVTFKIDRPKRINMVVYATTDPEIYKFSNLYLKYTLKDAEGKVLRSELKEFLLSDTQSGDLYGEVSGDFYKTACSITENFNFEPGTYSAEVLQYMREDPLKGFVSAEIVVSDSSTP